MTSEWERLKARMVKVVEREASELEVEHGWTRKLVSVGGWPHKYIYSYYNDKGYLSPLSTGEWKYTPKNENVAYVYGHPGERSKDLKYLMERYKA